MRDYSMDGQYRNSGGPDSYLGAQSTESAEFDIKASPTDNLKINLYGMLWKDSDGPGVIGKYTSANWNCNAGAAPKGTLNYYCGTLPAFNLANVGMDTVIDPLFKVGHPRQFKQGAEPDPAQFRRSWRARTAGVSLFMPISTTRSNLSASLSRR